MSDATGRSEVLIASLLPRQSVGVSASWAAVWRQFVDSPHIHLYPLKHTNELVLFPAAMAVSVVLSARESRILDIVSPGRREDRV